MNLVVTRHTLALRIEHQRRVAHLALGIGHERNRAAHQPNFMALREFGEKVLLRSTAVRFAHAHLGLLVGGDQRKVLRQGHQARTRSRSLGHQTGDGLQILLHIRPGHGLDRGNARACRCV